jgi:predicted TPR repeat methyltransferase
MLDEARRRGLYDALVHDDVVGHLRSTREQHDLVVAADVFIYIGALGPVFEGIARVLEDDGLFAFTVEVADDRDDVVLLPSLRYAHSERHVRALAAQQGLALASLVRAPLRREQAREIEGLYVVLGR